MGVCFLGALHVTSVSSPSPGTFVGFEADDQSRDQMAFYILMSSLCIRVNFWGGERENRQACYWSWSHELPVADNLVENEDILWVD